MNPKGSYKNSDNGIETQVLYLNYGATGGVSDLNPADNTFYVAHCSTWGSLPGVNSLGFTQASKSRLNGRIIGVSCSAWFTTTGSSLPVYVELYIRNANFPTTTSAGKKKRIGQVYWNDQFNPQPSFIPCDIPIKRGDSISATFLTPAWPTNPLRVNYTMQIFIEGRSTLQYPKKVQGLKNYDALWNCASNNALSDSTRYSFVQFNTPLTAGTTNLWYQVSPYTGFIEEIFYSCLNASGVQGSSELSELRVRIVDQKNPNLSGDYLAGYVSFDMPISTAITKFLPCEIPVRKGQLINLYFITGVFATNPTTSRMYAYAHIRGN